MRHGEPLLLVEFVIDRWVNEGQNLFIPQNIIVLTNVNWFAAKKEDV
jgi:hypothetical protein